MNIAIIGDGDTVIGFRLAGVGATYEVKPQEVPNVLDQILEKEYDVIIITEKMAAFIKERISEINRESKPIIVEIPDKGGSTGYSREALKETIKRAVGVDVTARREQK